MKTIRNAKLGDASQIPDTLDDILRAAAHRTTSPAVRRWLLALLDAPEQAKPAIACTRTIRQTRRQKARR